MQKWSYFCLDHFVLHAGYVLNTLLRIRIININPRSIAIEKLYLVILVFWKSSGCMFLRGVVLFSSLTVCVYYARMEFLLFYNDICGLFLSPVLCLIYFSCQWNVHDMSLKCNYAPITSSSLVNASCVIFNYGMLLYTILFLIVLSDGFVSGLSGWIFCDYLLYCVLSWSGLLRCIKLSGHLSPVNDLISLILIVVRE